MRTHTLPVGLAILLSCPLALAATRTVGPGKTYGKPCAAFAAAADGDTIEIDAAGSYAGDVCIFKKNKLTIRGVGGKAKIDAAGKNAGGKGIWVIQGNDTVVEDVELFGAAVADQNGAGIRQEGNNLTVRRVFFHDNENGILGGGDNTSVVIVEDSEFARNGYGDGQSHNMYIGEVKSFTLRGSYSHNAKVGHLVKSRALENNILYNRLTDETGTASYELDLPQGGKSYVIGNIIQQSASTDNYGLISFAREPKRNPDTALFAVNNTFFNSRGSGIFVAVAADVSTVVLRNNIFAGPGTVTDLASAVKDNNYIGDPMFLNAAAYDFHLKAGSPAIDKGVPAGTGSGRSLEALCQYVHPTRAMLRKNVGTADQGGFELGGETTTPCGATSSPGDAGPADAGPPSDGGTITDGGGSDSGAPGSDSATPDDTGVAVDDGGIIVADDSGVTSETGSGDAPSGDTGDGGGCSATRRSTTTSFALLSGLLVYAFARRRNSRRV